MDEPLRISDDMAAVRDRHRRAADELIRDEELRLYIDGEWIESDSEKRLEIVNPTTDTPLASAPAANAADVERAVTAAWRGFESWGEYDPSERQRTLGRIADRIEANAERLARIDVLDNGKPITEARTDVELVADHFRYFSGVLRSLEGKTVPGGDGQHVETLREPYGVVAGIIPWNFPLLMATWKLAPALAAGNAIVLKPAEETPLSVVELLHLAGDLLPDGTVNVIMGYGPEAGRALVQHDRIGKVAFTGAVETGKGVMKDAADNITDLTLELGGKSPIVVFPDADIGTAVDVATEAMFFNCGECCCAGTRLFVHEDVYDRFTSAFVAAAESLTIGDPLSESTDLGPEITHTQRNRTEHYISLAEDAGAEVLTGGPATDRRLEAGYFVEPTVIESVPHESRVVQEEIFGPVEVLFEWSEYDDMIDRANDIDFGLAAGIVTEDLEDAHRAARDMEAGNIWVNQYNTFPAGQPFGGYKQSGMGRETARETLEAYTRTKTINFNLERS
ncbi:MAG: aldehyde dehydrogenase (NAD+) [Natronomonas sp.]|mgnify:CR=1 FL=1|jgi:aldehyde dehydrogenase (NAD+)